MLSLKFIREQPEAVRRAIAAKALTLDLDALLALDAEVRAKTQRLEALRGRKKALSKGFKALSEADRAARSRESRALDPEIAALSGALEAERAALQDLLLRVPNIPWEGAPVGPDAESNSVLRHEGRPPAFGFAPRDHVELMELNGWAELSRVTRVCGARTYALKGRLALLEQALLLHALQGLTAAGFTVLSLPALAREAAFTASGHFPFGEEDAFRLPEDGLLLSGTAEVVLNSLHGGEILEAARLPLCYAGISPCFRREAGNAGRDVRGLLRVHQFVKVEQYVICRDDPEESALWHGRLLANAEALLRDLELPYRVVECATGDMGPGKFRMNDIETWVPSLAKYRETHSCSSLHDWQARRSELRYRGRDGKLRLVHTLNNTAIASPRILAPLLETHQTAEGRLRLPARLRGWFGGAEFL